MPLPTWDSVFPVSEDLQLALADWPGQVKYHLPQDVRLSLIQQLPFKYNTLLSSSPLSHALTVFADGSKHRGACTYLFHNQWQTRLTAPQTSAQRSELAAAILAFQEMNSQPFNLILDSLYVTNIVLHIFDAYLSPSLDAPLLLLFNTLQTLVMARRHHYFVAHIRSHQPFSGPLTEGNEHADTAARSPPPPPPLSTLSLSPLTPWESHSYFHQNAKALARQFSITKTEASANIQQCPVCSSQASSLPMGVNPRGLHVNEIWQMDITQYNSFSPWKYLHVCIDTFSGMIYATPQRGETTKHVINHCIRTFSVLGKPGQIKTDNGPAYVSSSFASFCNTWNIIHKFGIPYNSSGQSVVERENLTLKNNLEKLKKEVTGPGLPSIQNTLYRALFTMNFLNVSASTNITAAQKHFSPPPDSPSLSRPPVYYRELPDPTWRGPVDLIAWGRGFAAIQLPDRVLWVPGRNVRPYLPKARQDISAP